MNRHNNRATIVRVATCAVLVGVWTMAPAQVDRRWTAVTGHDGQDDQLFGGVNHLVGSRENTLITSNPTTFTGSNVATLIGADRFYNAGFAGQSTITTNIEAGHIWNGHETLGHVVNFTDASTSFDDGNIAGQTQADLYDRHATWVGMHIGGRHGGAVQGPWQTGIAPDTDLRSGAVASNWGAGPAYELGFNFFQSSFTVPYLTHFGSADVINSSWGGTDSDVDNFLAVGVDGLANERPSTTFVTSAGNDGPDANTVGWPGSGYNSITVGALQNDNDVYDSVANFSSRGPQDYRDPTNGIVTGERAAIDIAAPGTDLTAAFYGGQSGGNHAGLAGSANIPGDDLYSGGLAGTSFAAPITAGAASLIDSASYNTGALAANAHSRDARVVKAVLLNSADKIPGWDNGQTAHVNGNGGVQTTQSLDWASGAGALNLDRAFDQYLSVGTRDVAGLGGGNVDVFGWDFGQVENGATNVYAITPQLLGGSPFTITLDWFRDRQIDEDNLPTNSGGDPFITEDTVFDLAQANLDLIIRDRVTADVISESISMYNVVEHLHFTLPKTSFYDIYVHFDGTTFGNLGAEQYGLAWWSVSVAEPGTLALLMAAMLGMRSRRARA